MRAITQDHYGDADSLHLRDLPTPEVDDGQVLVRIAAAGVDRGAYHLMRGLPHLVRLMGYGLRSPKVPVPGTNIAGTVEAVGADVTRLRQGDEVYGTCKGAFAEYVAADENRLAPKPAGLTFEEAAVLPYPAAVSLQAVRDKAKVEPGQSVLVVGASGAVGTVAVQVARAHGAEVTGVCSTSNVELVRRLGAGRVIDYTRHDFASGENHFDVVLDIGGNTPVSRLRRALTATGMLVIVGGEGGGTLIGGIQRQLWAQLLSPFVSQKLTTFIASEDAELLIAFNELVAAGHVKPVIGRCYPLADTASAVRDLDSGGIQGRLVVAGMNGHARTWVER